MNKIGYFFKRICLLVTFITFITGPSFVKGNAVSLSFSDQLNEGDTFTWVITRNRRNGVPINESIWQEGSIIEVEVTSDLSEFNYYYQSIANILLDEMFNITIGGIKVSGDHVSNFIIPIVIQYENNSIQNFFDWQVETEPLIKDASHMISNEIIDGEFINLIQIFDEKIGMKLETRYDYNLGLVNLFNSTSSNFELTIERLRSEIVESDKLDFSTMWMIMIIILLPLTTYFRAIRHKR